MRAVRQNAGLTRRAGRSGRRSELAFPVDAEVRQEVERIGAGCRCGWRSARWPPSEPATYGPFAVLASSSDTERARQLWERHLVLDVGGDRRADVARPGLDRRCFDAGRLVGALETADWNRYGLQVVFVEPRDVRELLRWLGDELTARRGEPVRIDVLQPFAPAATVQARWIVTVLDVTQYRHGEPYDEDAWKRLLGLWTGERLEQSAVNGPTLLLAPRAVRDLIQAEVRDLHGPVLEVAHAM